MIRWPAAALLFAAGLLGWPLASAQSASSVDGNGKTNGTVAKPAPHYEDRLIDGGALAPDTESDGAPPNSQGWARFWRVEGVASYFDQQGQITRENGARFSGRIDTPQYGALSIDATVRVGPGSFIATLVQRDLGFDGNWRANNSLGVVTTLGIDMTRNQYRFYIPTFAALGGTTEWIHDGDLQVQASVGEPGNFDGFRLAGFQSLHGTLATMGAQWAFAPRWQAGVQFIDAQGVDSPFAVNGNGRIDSDAVFAALAWSGPTTRLQANIVASDASSEGQAVRANGIWLDGRTVWDRTTHNYGVFRLEPGLTWGYQPINNDIEGAYYRIAYQSLRWQMDGGIDQVNSVSGRGGNGTYLTLNGRYQLNTRMGLGGNGGYLKNGSQHAVSASAFGDLLWSQGASRLQFNLLDNNNVPKNHAEQVSLDHTWNTPVGTRLSTSMTATRDTTGSLTAGNLTLPRSTIHRLGVGLLGGGDITNNVSVDANLQYNLLSRGGTASGIYGNVNVNWRLSPQWSVTGTYYDNRDDTANLFVLDPLVPVINQLPTQRSRAVLLSLRYEERAGTATVPLGGQPGTAAGTIAGTLFLDLNDNGQRDAGEPGAPNVTVLLNGRYQTRTDESGRFDFPLVATGIHTITVVPDNLPLPWSLGGSKFDVNVNARSTSTMDIGARRIR
ncbi:MAG: hypothetical protein ABI607_14850 [Betaproteobacteria bacterium]